MKQFDASGMTWRKASDPGVAPSAGQGTSPSGGGKALWLVVLVCTLSLFASGSFGQQADSAPAKPQENRYLLIVNVSKSMLPRAPGSLAAIGELLATGMDGQIRDGDDFAVWTFCEDLYAGRFPIQRWTAAEQGAISARVLTYLRDQTIGKEANLDKMMTAVDFVVKDSDAITFIIITDGEQKFHGTPFDNQINDFCSRLEKKQKKAKMPFVIAVKAVKGRMTDYLVSIPPRPIRVPTAPPLPTPQPVPIAVSVPAPPANNPPTDAAPKTNLAAGAMAFAGSNPTPIAVSGGTNSTVAKAPAASAVARVGPAASISGDVVGALGSLAASREPEAEPALGSVIEAPVFATSTVNSNLPVVIPQPKAEQPAPAPAVAIVASIPANLPTATPAAPLNVESPRVAESIAATPGTMKQAVPEGALAPAEPKAQPPAAPKANPTDARAGIPTPPATPAVTTVTTAVASAGIPPNVHPNDVRPVAARPHAHPAPMAAQPQVAMASPATAFVNSWTFWAAAVLLVAIALSCSILIVRRSRPFSSPSLITCSFDRNRRG